MAYQLSCENEVRRMASLGCTTEEIAQKLSVTTNQLISKYGVPYREGKAEMLENLRAAQFKCAYENVGNCTMLIFLGKFYLHQREVTQEDKLSELDTLLKHLTDKSECLNSRQNNWKAIEVPMPG